MLLLYADNDQATVAVRRLQQQTGQRVMVQNPKYFDGSIPSGFLGESDAPAEPMAGHYYVPGCRHEEEIRMVFARAGVPLQPLGTANARVPPPVPPPQAPEDEDVVPTVQSSTEVPVAEAPKPKPKRKARKKRAAKKKAAKPAESAEA